MGKLAETIAAMEEDLLEKKAALDRVLSAAVVQGGGGGT
jgi:hypothetical protein